MKKHVQISIIGIVLAFSQVAWAGVYGGGQGQPASPYQISEAEHWLELTGRPDDWDKQFALTADIDFEEAQIMPVGSVDLPFTGVFDGQGYVMSNFVIDLPDNNYVGLFGFIDIGGEVVGLGLESVSVTGNQYVGGLCGFNRGTVSGSHVIGQVVGCDGDIGGLCGLNYDQGIIIDSYAAGTVEGLERVGGLCGYSSGDISRSNAACQVDGLEWVGGLCGENSGSVSESYATGAVEGRGIVGGLIGENTGMISDSYAAGGVDGRDSAGGLCGTNRGTISGCYAAGQVHSSAMAGGLCAWNYHGTITNSYAAGAVSGDEGFVGGLCGWNYEGIIEYSYAVGQVTATPGMTTLVGGLCGVNAGTIDWSFWDVETTHQPDSDGGQGKTMEQMRTLSTFADAGWDFTLIWQMPENGYPRLIWETLNMIAMPELVGLSPGQAQMALEAAGLAIAQKTYAYSGDVPAGLVMGQMPAGGQSLPQGQGIGIVVSLGPLYSGGDGSQVRPYKIATAADWQQLLEMPCQWDKHYLLTGDIDFAGAQITPVGTLAVQFGGVFDGKGYVLSNFKIDLDSDNTALFGYVAQAGLIKNVTIENIDVRGNARVGGLAGMNYGTIRNSHVGGVVDALDNAGGLAGYNWGSIVNSGADVVVTNRRFTLSHVGGLCGTNLGTVRGSWAKGQVISADVVGGLVGYNGGLIENSYARADVVAGENVGGLCGYNKGTIVASFAAGAVEAVATVGGLCGFNEGDIENSYAAGDISGVVAGGFCGFNYGTITNSYSAGTVEGDYYIGGFCGYDYGSIIDSFWDMDVSEPQSDGGQGKTTAQMQTLLTFTDAGWDFLGESANGADDVWRMCIDGVDYPVLRWQFSQAADLVCPDGVAVADLAYFAQMWMWDDSTQPNGRMWADINNDGRVDFLDFATLAGQWLMEIE